MYRPRVRADVPAETDTITATLPVGADGACTEFHPTGGAGTGAGFPRGRSRATASATATAAPASTITAAPASTFAGMVELDWPGWAGRTTVAWTAAAASPDPSSRTTTEIVCEAPRSMPLSVSCGPWVAWATPSTSQ